MDSNSITFMAITSIEGVADLMKILSPFMGFATAIIVSGAAIYGVCTWRREFVGKRNIELAEETLALFYQAKDVIAAIRSPFGFAGEGTTRKPMENETPEQKKVRDQAYTVFERYNQHKDLFSRLYTIRYRFTVQFGKYKALPFEEIHRIVTEIFVSAQMLGVEWAKRVDYLGPERQERHFDFIKQQEEIFWDHGPETELNKRLDKAVTTMEKTCRKIIMLK